jgi:hypothetical protein
MTTIPELNQVMDYAKVTENLALQAILEKANRNLSLNQLWIVYLMKPGRERANLGYITNMDRFHSFVAENYPLAKYDKDLNCYELQEFRSYISVEKLIKL